MSDDPNRGSAKKKNTKSKGYTFLAPEVLQISSMDCGVAALASFAQAYGCALSYERLRDACQTGVDGTSIDSLEDVSLALGIDVIQHILPQDLYLEAMEGRYPFIAIVRHDAGIPHFVVVWRRMGELLQVMNPSGGREWVLAETFLAGLYQHTHRMPTDAFLDWWPGSTFSETLEEVGLRTVSGRARELIAGVRDVNGVAEASAVDTAFRLTRFAMKKGIAGGQRDAMMETAYQGCLREFSARNVALPKMRSIGPVPLEEDMVGVTGVIALAPPERNQPRVSKVDTAEEALEAVMQKGVAAQVAAAATEEDLGKMSLFSTIWGYLDTKHRLLAVALAVANVIFVPVVMIETFMSRAAVDAGRVFDSTSVRVQVSLLVVTFFLIVVGLERLTEWGGRRVGAYLEVKLRLAVVQAMPRVDEQFVRSRPTTDLAQRAHALTTGRQLPYLLFSIVRTVVELAAALVALALIEPLCLPIVFVGALALTGVSYLSIASLREVGTRFQAHAARMLLMFLDALRGIRPVRTHGFQGPIRRDYDRELAGWRRTSEADQQRRGIFGALDTLVGVLITSGCLYAHVARHPDVRGFVLLAFWAMRIPGNVAGLVNVFRSYPGAELALTRILEVTRYARTDLPKAQIPKRDRGVKLFFKNVRVLVAGRTLLDTFSLNIPSGQHVAIVGPSGAGKSSLLGLLLGLLKPAAGTVLANDTPLDEETYPSLRAMTAWVDPATQLWNRSLLENVEYATTGDTRRPLEDVLVAANLFPVVDNLAEGLGTKIGWDGNFLSGGEGQRVRIARALLRSETKLAVLDEPFRGLDQVTRRKMLNEARKLWLNATLLFVSHDIGHALDFDRVLVVEDGQIVEDGHPLALRQEPESRFKLLLDAEERAKTSIWRSQEWRRLRIQDGVIREEAS